MASTIARLAVSLNANSSGFTKGMRGAKKELNSFQSSLSSMKRQAATALGAYFSVQGARNALSSWGRQEAAIRNLSASLEMIGKNSPQAVKEMERFATQLQGVTTYGDEAIVEVAALGARLGKFSGDDLKQATVASIGLSKALGMDLDGAMRLIIRAANGNTASLSKYGIKVSETGTAQEKFNQLLDFGTRSMALATAETQTYNGAMAQLANDIDDVGEVVGSKLAPALISASKLIRAYAIPAIENYNLAWKVVRLGATVEIYKLRDVAVQVLNEEIPNYLDELPKYAKVAFVDMRLAAETEIQSIIDSIKNIKFPKFPSLPKPFASSAPPAQGGSSTKSSPSAQGSSPSARKPYDKTGGQGFWAYLKPGNVTKQLGPRAGAITKAAQYTAIAAPAAAAMLATGGAAAGALPVLGGAMKIGGGALAIDALSRIPKAAVTNNTATTNAGIATGVGAGTWGARGLLGGFASGGVGAGIKGLAGGSVVGAIGGLSVELLQQLIENNSRKAAGSTSPYVPAAGGSAALKAALDGITASSIAGIAPSKYGSDTEGLIKEFEAALAAFREAAKKEPPDLGFNGINIDGKGGAVRTSGNPALVSNFLNRSPGSASTDQQMLAISKRQEQIAREGNGLLRQLINKDGERVDF